MTAGELSAAYASRAVSPVEVTGCVLDRAEQAGKALNAFCFIDSESAMAAARASEARWRTGDQKSPIDGVPVSIKDNIGTTGMPTRFGSRAVTEEEMWIPDGSAVARLREAGAILFGKTCCPDFGHKVVTDSPLTGVSRNPWNLAHTPGGSSGGAAAALAALIGPLALGTDGGGSIRIPASFTGVFGFKPSFGRVPQHPRGTYGPLSHVGPMTRSVKDAALMMNVIALPDRRDWYSLPYQEKNYVDELRLSLKGLRLAYSGNLGLTDVAVAPDVGHAVRRAVDRFVELGAIVEAADPPAVQKCREIHRVMWASLAARLASNLGERRALLDPSLERLAQRGEALPRDAFVNAVVARGDIGSETNEFFERYDIVICPVYHTTAPALAAYEAAGSLIPTLTNWCNLSGIPAASIHCGLGERGLPIGLQVVGGQGADAAVLAVCHAFEQVNPATHFPQVIG